MRRVLIIDDSAVARGAMRRILASDGFEIFEKDSPIGATVEILKNEIDLVVLDMNMPAMSGERFASLMRSNPRFRDLIIVLVSGDTRERLEAVGTTVEADATIPKAELEKALSATVARLLSSRESDR